MYTISALYQMINLNVSTYIHKYIYIYDFYLSDEHKLSSKSSKPNHLSSYKTSMGRPKMTLQNLHKVNMTVTHTTPVDESIFLT